MSRVTHTRRHVERRMCTNIANCCVTDRHGRRPEVAPEPTVQRAPATATAAGTVARAATVDCGQVQVVLSQVPGVPVQSCRPVRPGRRIRGRRCSGVPVDRGAVREQDRDRARGRKVAQQDHRRPLELNDRLERIRPLFVDELDRETHCVISSGID